MKHKLRGGGRNLWVLGVVLMFVSSASAQKDLRTLPCPICGQKVSMGKCESCGAIVDERADGRKTILEIDPLGLDALASHYFSMWQFWKRGPRTATSEKLAQEQLDELVAYWKQNPRIAAIGLPSWMPPEHAKYHPHGTKDCSLLDPLKKVENFDGLGHLNHLISESLNCPVCNPPPVRVAPPSQKVEPPPVERSRPVQRTPGPPASTPSSTLRPGDGLSPPSSGNATAPEAAPRGNDDLLDQVLGPSADGTSNDIKSVSPIQGGTNSDLLDQVFGGGTGARPGKSSPATPGMGRADDSARTDALNSVFGPSSPPTEQSPVSRGTRADGLRAIGSAVADGAKEVAGDFFDAIVAGTPGLVHDANIAKYSGKSPEAAEAYRGGKFITDYVDSATTGPGQVIDEQRGWLSPVVRYIRGKLGTQIPWLMNGGAAQREDNPKR